MKKIVQYYFIFSVFIGSIVYVAASFGIRLPKVVRFYLNDFLIIPIVLTSCLLVVRYLKGNQNLRLSIVQILYITAMYSILFEYWFPIFHSRYTADVFDVVMYFSGGTLFYFLQKNS